MKISIQAENAFKADVATRLQIHSLESHKLARQLEIDEASLPSYPHPLLKMKRTKNPFTLTSAVAFGHQIIHAMMP